MRPHPRRAQTNSTHPEAWGTSDRGGWVGNQRNLRWQMEYAGAGLINKRILVFEDEYDEPNPQLRTIILPPDPVSIINARPEPYAIDEQTYRVTMDGTQRFTMDGTARLESNLQGEENAGTYPG